MKLAELQARVAATIMSPLTGSDTIARRTLDGKNMRDEVGALIKPNDRLTAVERLEIYSKSYWFRILDGLYDDFPGLAAVLGTRAFYRMAKDYLTECPSQSYTMRNLGSRLAEWLQAHPEHSGPAPALAIDMARLEWAHIEAFDGLSRKPIGPEDLLEPGPDLRLSLQPHLSPLALRYPVDDFRIEAARSMSDDHLVASNAVGERKRGNLSRRFRRARPEPVFLAVYRREDSVYYRRLEREEYQVLLGLGAGCSIGEALERMLADPDNSIPIEELGPRVEQWFAAWSELAWLCLPEPEDAEREA